jgi:hypothetical protein
MQQPWNQKDSFIEPTPVGCWRSWNVFRRKLFDLSVSWILKTKDSTRILHFWISMMLTCMLLDQCSFLPLHYAWYNLADPWSLGPIFRASFLSFIAGLFGFCLTYLAAAKCFEALGSQTQWYRRHTSQIAAAVLSYRVFGVGLKCSWWLEFGLHLASIC